MPSSKPPINNIPFSFSSTGYTAPDFSSVPFRMGLRPSYQQTADMQAAISVYGPSSCTDTYTYVKEQKTYVVGYSRRGVQILQGNTIYGGIRDLCATLISQPPNVDLQAYIYVLSNYLDLNAYLHTFKTDYFDLSTDIYPIPPSNLLALLHGWDTSNLLTSIHGWATRNITAYIGMHPPNDLQAILNVIEIRNLSSSIVGEWWHGSFDLSAGPYKIWKREYKDIQTVIRGWATKDLSAYINSVYFKDLLAIILSNSPSDLSATISSIDPVDLIGNIHGFDIRYLQGIINGVFGDGDLQAFINSVIPSDLSAYIRAYTGIKIPFDLKAILYGSYSSDLYAYINGLSPVDLGAIIECIGTSSDIGASIIPSTILMKRIIQIPLLEYKNLVAVINFMCFNSDYSNLHASMYTIYKKDLSAFIIGWFGNAADNVIDLGAYINAASYIVQDRQPIKFVPAPIKYTRLKLNFGVDGLKPITYATIDILFGSYYSKNLQASINGILTSFDLGASLNAEWDWNYSELPPYIKPKTHEVFINIDRFEEQWKRFVELLFDRDGKDPFKYFYVNGTKKVYKIDRSRHWTIWADGYTEVNNSMIDRANVRRKFIFRLSDYDTMDEAIRELMERAAYPTSSDLSAYIDGGPAPALDLNASLKAVSHYRWFSNLNSLVYPSYTEYSDLSVEIYPEV